MTMRPWMLVALLAGCAPAREDPTTAMLVAGATGTFEGLNRAQSCTCTFDPVDTNRRRFALGLKCMNGAEAVLEKSWNVLLPVRNQRLLLPADVSDFGRSIMIATLGSGRIDPRGAPFDDHVVFPLYIHLLRDGYEHPSVDQTDVFPWLVFAAASLPVTRGELRDALFWCEDALATKNIDDYRRPDAGT